MISDEDIDQALDRIARTADGELLYRFCQKQMTGLLGEYVPEEGALRVEHGMRRFAQMLMAKMAKGIDESDGRTDPSSRSASQRTIVFRRGAEPARTGRHVNIRDHLRVSDGELQRIGTSGGADG